MNKCSACGHARVFHAEVGIFICCSRRDDGQRCECTRFVPSKDNTNETSTVKPIRMRLPCESCGELHVDEGQSATHNHHTHQCAFCGLVWRPAEECTVGVKYLWPQSKENTLATCQRMQSKRSAASNTR